MSPLKGARRVCLVLGCPEGTGGLSLRLLLTEHPPPFSREAKDSSALSGISSKRGDIFAKPPLLEVIPHGVGKCHRR